MFGGYANWEINQTRIGRKSVEVLLCLLFSFGFCVPAHSLVLDSSLEVVYLPAVSTSWQSVSLANSYSNAIPVCTYVLPSFSGSAPNYDHPPAVVRIRNIGSNSFDVKVQGWENSAASTSAVHCIVAESGAHKLPDGRQFEAHSVLSDKTSGQYSTDGAWSQAILEDVSSTIVHSYSQPVVLGQVISYNDSRASVFYNSDCDARQNEPFLSGQADGICVGKHIGMIKSSRNPEMVGYIVAESGSGTVNNVFYELGKGSDSVAGNTGANTGYTYALARDHNIAVLTQGAEDGGNGSWAVLYGADPLPSNQMILAVDEEVFAGDVSRGHTKEPVYYWAFAGAEITLTKKVINDDGGVLTFSSFPLTATGLDTITGYHGDASVTNMPVQPGVYTLSEANQPGYGASDWVCSGAVVSGGNTIKLKGGDKADCTIVNDDFPFSTLTLVKKVINDGGGSLLESDFTLKFDNGAGTSGSGVTGDTAITNVVVAPGIYDLTESQLTGYRLTGIKCDGADPDGMDKLKITDGEKITCVFVNDDQSVDLQIAKTADSTAPNIGQTITFSLTVVNNGPDTATNVSIVDVIPPGFSYVPASISGGSTNSDSSPATSGLNWSINTLNSGASELLSFQAVVNAP